MILVSPVGVEPTANRLKVGCSTTELQALSKLAEVTNHASVGGRKNHLSTHTVKWVGHSFAENAVYPGMNIVF